MLSGLAAEGRATEVLSRNQISGRLKVEVLQEVVASLIGIGISDRNDFDAHVGSAKSAWLAIHGLGAASWQYVCSLSGVETVKPDTVLVRFVTRELTRTVDQATTTALLLATLEEIQHRCPSADPSWTARSLDHYIWRWESGRGEA